MEKNKYITFFLNTVVTIADDMEDTV